MTEKGLSGNALKVIAIVAQELIKNVQLKCCGI